MRSLISEELNNKLNQIVTMCFLGNRIADRGVSVLEVKFCMNKTGNILHSKLAHLFPVLGDFISDYQNARNELTIYGNTPRDDTDYQSPMEFFERMLDYMTDLEALVGDAIEKSKDEFDYTTKCLLNQFLLKLIPVTNQCLLLFDKGEKYNNDWMAFDHNVEDFIIL